MFEGTSVHPHLDLHHFSPWHKMESGVVELAHVCVLSRVHGLEFLGQQSHTHARVLLHPTASVHTYSTKHQGSRDGIVFQVVSWRHVLPMKQ